MKTKPDSATGATEALHCPKCGSTDIEPSRHRSAERLVLGMLYKRPYRCWAGRRRFYASLHYFEQRLAG